MYGCHLFCDATEYELIFPAVEFDFFYSEEVKDSVGGKLSIDSVDLKLKNNGIIK